LSLFTGESATRHAGAPELTDRSSYDGVTL